MYPLTPYPITPIGSFVGFLLAVIPLPLQFRTWNTAICVYGLWLAVTNFQYFVNFVIWHDNVDIVAPVWCDIVTRIQVSCCVGVRACTFVLGLQLFRISRRSAVCNASRTDKRKTLILELLLTIGVPSLVIALYVVIQPVRFYIIEEVGCQNIEFSYLTYVIVYLPELAFTLASVCLAPWTISAFLRLRRESKASLKSSAWSSSSSDPTSSTNSSSIMSPGRFKRLLFITLLDTTINLPLLLSNFAKCILAGKQNPANYPYKSWDYVHGGGAAADTGLFPANATLTTIVQVPASVWGGEMWTVVNVKWVEWVYVLHAVVYCAVFGTVPKLRGWYGDAFWKVVGWLGWQRRGRGEREEGGVEKREGASEIEFRKDTALSGFSQSSCLSTTVSFDGTTACEHGEVPVPDAVFFLDSRSVIGSFPSPPNWNMKEDAKSGSFSMPSTRTDSDSVV
ncbi:STE3-domain-containing protein [Schizopora paradoxa]|uniref:STE3-domain-containing protein n=1 Tax=Schizopora paradoxa TaxID=27342 RepID=A0A0H2RBV0_9AGAM|nr:STE3-domain-containing protein [Schizopora paradoxa]